MNFPPLLSNLSRHSEKIAQWAFLLSTSSLVIKNIDTDWRDFQVQMDLIAAFFFFISSLCYGLLAVNRNYIRLAGFSIMVASIALSAGGFRGDWFEASFYLQITSMIPTFLAGIFFMAGRISWGVLPELALRPVHLIAGLMQGDIGQAVFAILGTIGGLALLVTDRKHKKTGH